MLRFIVKTNGFFVDIFGKGVKIYADPSNP